MPTCVGYGLGVLDEKVLHSCGLCVNYESDVLDEKKFYVSVGMCRL